MSEQRCYCCRKHFEQETGYQVDVGFAGIFEHEGKQYPHMRSIRQFVCTRECLATLFLSVASDLKEKPNV